MKVILGWFLISIPFIAIFVAEVARDGFWHATWLLLCFACVAVLVCVGVSLAFGGSSK